MLYKHRPPQRKPSAAPAPLDAADKICSELCMQCLEAVALFRAASSQAAACNSTGCRLPSTAAPLQLMQATGILEARLHLQNQELTRRQATA